MYCDHKTEFVFDVLGDNEMRNVKKGDIIQISRRGYYICDEPFKPNGTTQNGVLGGEALVLFNIPEGNKRESPTSYMTISQQQYESVRVADEAELKTQTAKTASKENKAPTLTSFNLEEINKKISNQGEVIRNLKAQKAPKVIFDLVWFGL